MTTSFSRGALRTPLIGALMALASVFLVACGGDNTAGSRTPSPATTQDQETTGAGPADSPIGEPVSGTVIVFSAASLTDAFTEIGESFMAAKPEVEVEFNFQGSSALRTQIEEGAPADVFASANTAHMDALVDAGLAQEPTLFVHNSLVIIAPSDNRAGIESLADLANPGLKLVLAAEEVPVGGYSREMLDKASADREYGAGFKDAVLANLVSNESNVKQVVTKVQLGEADAGIVYGSDVTPHVAPALETIEVPDALNVIADYPIAALTESENVDAAAAFVAFVLSTEGQEILARWGFSTI